MFCVYSVSMLLSGIVSSPIVQPEIQVVMTLLAEKAASAASKIVPFFTPKWTTLRSMAQNVVDSQRKKSTFSG